MAEGYPNKSLSTGDNSDKYLDLNGSDSASANSLRLMGVAFRSESEDSGMESPSMVSPLKLHHCSLSPQTMDDLCPASSSPACSLRSSSSSCLSKGSLKPVDTASFMVEEALQRTEPAWRRSVDGSLRRRCNTSLVTSGLHASLIRRRAAGIRAERVADEELESKKLLHTHLQEHSGINKEDPAKVCSTCHFE